jgi:hypothetical protein
MGPIHIDLFTTLDGVAQAPGGPDEDTDSGFVFGGWQAPLLDEVVGEQVNSGMAGMDALLLGRRTYDIFAAYWPTKRRVRTGASRDCSTASRNTWPRANRGPLSGPAPRCLVRIPPSPCANCATDTRTSTSSAASISCRPCSPNGSSIGSRSGCTQSSSGVGRRSSQTGWFRRTSDSSSRSSPRQRAR